jgi:hypothetical protein
MQPLDPNVLVRMHQPSPASTLAFVMLVWSLAALVWLGSRLAGERLGESPELARRWEGRTAMTLLAWLLITALVPASGVLRTLTLPPPMLGYALVSVLVPVWAAFSGLGTRIAHGVPIAALVLVQAFRLPLELILHSWYAQGSIPVQMTYEGHNFDIVSGSLALVSGLYMLLTHSAPRALAWTFNLVGSALLLAVATIAITSTPTPLRLYTEGQPLLVGAYFPYAWIVPICVGGALFGHLVLFRRLWATRGASANAA